MRFCGYLFLLLALMACNHDKDPVVDQPVKTKQFVPEEKFDSSAICEMRSLMLDAGLVSIESVDTRIIVDLRYASTNNFMKMRLYDSITEAFLQIEVAERLSRCQEYLDSLMPGYRLKVLDATRPQSVQWKIWRALDTVPLFRRGNFVSNPALGSVHNFGAAVDVTLCDEAGNELDMGAGYDDFRPIAFPSREAYYLKTGELSEEQVSNRKLLRAVMRSQKFSNIPSEWWHFNACSRWMAGAKYDIVMNEFGKHLRWYTRPKAKDSIVFAVPI